MNTLEYTVRFNTPAFLGNAEQNAQWRTPPIKALLRQWWRVTYAAEKNYAVRVDDMRTAEGLLFGNAWLENQFSKSLVRMRLDQWGEGNLKKQQWPTDITISHPEVKSPVGSALYLGYGPLEFRNGTTLKKNAAIQAGETATLSIAVPDEQSPRIKHALWLMDRYGTLGGRSRNGWGSFSLLPLPPGEGWGEGNLPLRPWQDCLQLDWPHAIGTDQQQNSLIWQTQSFGDWRAVMQHLARLKIGLRTQFAFPNAAPGLVHQRHWLSYPVTNHSVAAWDNNARLPNALRFKVRRTDDNQFVGVIFHVPHTPPAKFQPNAQTLQQVWSTVYGFLDAPAQQLTRIPE